jgi:putative flippase GtrA
MSRSYPVVPARSHKRLLWMNAVVSVVTVLAEYVLYLLLVEVGEVDIRVANVTAGSTGIAINFLLSRLWVFPDALGHWFGQLVRYGVATALGIAGSTGLLHLQVEWGEIPHWIAWGLANLTMFTLWTYPTNRYIVFPARARLAREPVPEPATSEATSPRSGS